jgi:hypothetical protein
MAMIEQQPAQPIAVLARTAAGIVARAVLRGSGRALAGRRVAVVGAAVALLLVLLLGLPGLRLWITTSYGYLLIPGALGVPMLLPGLRLTPLPDQSWTALGCEDFAALLLVGMVYLLLGRHRRNNPGSGRLHRFLVGWGALMAGGLLSGFFRGLVVARVTAGGPLAYFGYPVLGAVFGLGWCLMLGWLTGLAAVFALVPSAAVERGREWWAESGRLVLVYLVEPVGEGLARLRAELRERNIVWPGTGAGSGMDAGTGTTTDATTGGGDAGPQDENHRASGGTAP